MGMIALALLAGFAPEGEVLQPSTAWSVDYAEYSCTLSRRYGTGDALVQLELTPQTGGNRLSVSLASKDRNRFAVRGKAAIGVGEGSPLEAPGSDRFYSIDDPAKGRIATMRTMREVLTPLATAKTLTVQMGDTRLTLAVPQFGAALKALAECERDLAGGWGFDLSAIATAPVPMAPQRWITPDDYPTEALRASLSGETGLLIIVDAAGKPQRCAVTDSSGAIMLDQTACVLILRRGQFQPATGKDGKPMTAPWATSFRWEIPGS